MKVNPWLGRPPLLDWEFTHHNSQPLRRLGYASMCSDRLNTTIPRSKYRYRSRYRCQVEKHLTLPWIGGISAISLWRFGALSFIFLHCTYCSLLTIAISKVGSTGVSLLGKTMMLSVSNLLLKLETASQSHYKYVPKAITRQ